MSLSLLNAPPAAAPTPNGSSGGALQTIGSGLGGLLGGAGAVLGGVLGTVGDALLGGGTADPGRANPAPATLTGSSGALSPTGIAGLPLEMPAGGYHARRPNRRMVRRLVMLVGVEQAAAIIGYGVPQTAMMALTGFRRSRGISARDLRVTRRVTRRVLGIARDLAALKPRARR